TLHDNIFSYHLSSYSIIVIAYSAPLSLYILGWFIFFPNLLPTEDLQAKMMESISRFHGTNTTQFRVYGFPFIGKTRYSAAMPCSSTSFPLTRPAMHFWASALSKYGSNCFTMDHRLVRRQRKCSVTFGVLILLKVFFLSCSC
ncbi:hypothetical protein PMAYCL1PPCAC_16871, partial [Pristionchus mayeri]